LLQTLFTILSLIGYLISVNHILHPVKLLTDGNWHKAIIHLPTLALRFDDSRSTAISLRPSNGDQSSSSQITEIAILLKSQITAIHLNPLPPSSSASKKSKTPKMKSESKWLCTSEHITAKQSTSFNFGQHICAGRGGKSEESRSFCNCRGPNSALASNGNVASCASPDPYDGRPYSI
jgi:hypothetical protein